MAKLKANSLHVSFSLNGVILDDPENPVGYNENDTIVVDFGNEVALEEHLTAHPWLSEILSPVIKELNKKYEERTATAALPKEKSKALKEKLKGLV